MSSILVINAAGRETRVALVENSHISEFYLERKKDKGIVGNIYKGRVVRVLPGMQAAFVDVGLDKAAFLYVSDVVYDPDFARAQFELTEGEHEDAPEVPDEEGAPLAEADADAQEAPEAEASAETPPALATSDSDEAAEGTSERASVDSEETAEGAPAPASAHSAEAVETSESAEPEVELEVQELPPGELAPPPNGVPPRRITGEMPLVAGGNEAPAETPPTAAPAVAAPHEEGPAPTGPQARGERHRPRELSGRSKRRHGERRGGRPEENVRKLPKIEDVLKVGQEVVVQISKDPIGTKGARLTSHISIPGRHLVFMPTVDHVGISRRISNEKERRRLRDIVERLRPPGTGFIVRTVAENVPQEKLESDIRFLIGIWNQVVRRNEKRGGPGLIHPDLDLILRATRDLFAQDVEQLVVDDRDEYERILSFVADQDPALKSRVVLHDSEEPIFDAYGIEQEIQRAVQRKVWLKSGGYLIIDQAEALTAIDVNSGRYVGKKSLEETITKINVEAAKEIVYQLRLRNIGGIIICDFIDMEKPQNRERVFKTLQEALGRDKAKTNVLRISELGLVEMTRKRVRESIGRILHEDCAYCDGQGFVKTATTVAYQIFRDIRREAPNHKDAVLAVSCHPDVARLLQGEERQELRHLMDRYNKTIQVRPQPTYHRDQYELYGRVAEGHDHKLASSPPHKRTEGESGERGRGDDRRGPPTRGRDRGQERKPSTPQGAPHSSEAAPTRRENGASSEVGGGEPKNP
jgi:ribonuclease G